MDYSSLQPFDGDAMMQDAPMMDVEEPVLSESLVQQNQHPDQRQEQLSAARDLPAQPASSSAVREPVRNLAVKVHIRKSGRVAWKYVGRAHAMQEFHGNSSRVVIRSVSSGKVLTTFSEMSDVQADKRGTFIVVASVESSGVTSWSLNAVNNSDALKLLASIELACYRCKQAILDPGRYNKSRRRIEKVVREDRRKRHNNKREEDELATAFGQQTIAADEGSTSSTPFDTHFPVDVPSAPAPAPAPMAMAMQ
ncbi:hypothetical protein EXIGLDRAFT_720872 [Exidia glandulosa HHB12029]|uniref:Uncharacterized protein n=1 Tax=Exidia glandulosa HHB12029 TaxID=1314781 RepID=A0A165NEM9_EXIGL|nr:hypothetical protein EXIGLDRAFT_720872 [Exidia glandulosa HHB12029]